jgi:hypothetical protein
LEAIPGKLSTDSLQKTAFVGTSHIICKYCSLKLESLSGGDHRWFRRKYRGEKACDNNNNNNTIIIIIIIIQKTAIMDNAHTLRKVLP